MSSSGRTALVTGGNRGLGAAIARALDDAGHRVIITHTPGKSRRAFDRYDRADYWPQICAEVGASSSQ